ncbi:unnamed protein product [Sphagnum jensenii]|uniref:Protein kinase domain-containing protein n=1 Tax=Sphagnum jensenii TaxID=128206 RepID=A0ABP0VCE9_9BRYO
MYTNTLGQPFDNITKANAKKDIENESLESFFDLTKQSPNDILNKLYRLPFLGSGSSAEVYRLWDSSRKCFFALKRFYSYSGFFGFSILDDPSVNEDLIRECSILLNSSHPNIVTLYTIYVVDNSIFLVYEYANMTVKKLLDDKYSKGLPHNILRSMAWDLFSGLDYLHSKGILHRDLRVSNVLAVYPPPTAARGVKDGNIVSVTAPSTTSTPLPTTPTIQEGILKPDLNQIPTLKIIDFDWSKVDIPQHRATPYLADYATVRNRAPEGLFNVQYMTTKADMWSSACILLHMFWGQPLGFSFDSDQWIEFLVKYLGMPTWQEQQVLRENAGRKHVQQTYDRSQVVRHYQTYESPRVVLSCSYANRGGRAVYGLDPQTVEMGPRAATERQRGHGSSLLQLNTRCQNGDLSRNEHRQAVHGLHGTTDI